MANIKNLKSYKPGQSGNPAGRPVIPNLNAVMCEVVGEDGIRNLVKTLQSLAAKGNVRAIEILLDRFYGKAKERIEYSEPLTCEDVTAKLIRRVKAMQNDDSNNFQT